MPVDTGPGNPRGRADLGDRYRMKAFAGDQVRGRCQDTALAFRIAGADMALRSAEGLTSDKFTSKVCRDSLCTGDDLGVHGRTGESHNATSIANNPA